MNLVEFLEARITEDERKAEAGGYHNSGEVFANDNYGCLLVQPSRILAECAAKRAIIAQAGEIEKMEMAVDEEWGGGLDWLGLGLLITLAAVYKDHPDYREEWSSAT